ncbi:hypothetical protein BGX12_101118 [Fibrobacter sp. UWR4]|nr:hypothetical protein BGX12_101118 [Fibrobacter sp. UWR4]PZW73794.1 hypothetical protein C8E88_1002117 [Fibrobacter sp. UWR1]
MYKVFVSKECQSAGFLIESLYFILNGRFGLLQTRFHPISMALARSLTCALNNALLGSLK